GFAPAHDPRIVIAAIVENGHPDNTVSLAVPLATNLVQAYLQSEGVPPTGIPVPRQPAGRRATPGPTTPEPAPPTGVRTDTAGRWRGGSSAGWAIRPSSAAPACSPCSGWG